MKENELIEIKKFLEGENDDYKYIVNVECDRNTNIAECVIHEPNGDKYIKEITYTPFLHVKDLRKYNIVLYNNNAELIQLKMRQYGITFKKLETGNQQRMEDGYTHLVTSTISFNSIVEFYKEGGLFIYENKRDHNGRPVLDYKGEKIQTNRHFFNTLRPEEQFFISTKSRLFKGVDNYEDLHKFTFDIETQGLRYSINRIFSIAVKDNRGFEKFLFVKKNEDDESEKRLIEEFFECIDLLKPAVISGYNSEEFDFDFIINRAQILGVDLSKLKTTLRDDKHLRRYDKASVKVGSGTLRYTSTIMWGYTVIDIMHAVKKTAAINSEIKEFGLEYISNFEGVARENRMRIDGDDAGIYHIWRDDKISFINRKTNKYIIIPDEYQDVGRVLYKLINTRNNGTINDEQYNNIRNSIIKDNSQFIEWLKKRNPNNYYNEIISGREILKEYVLDDINETHLIDDLYNKAYFMLGKMTPTTFQRVATMGTASIWNLILTAWSFNNNLAIPIFDEKENFPGGLSRCFKTGYSERLIKIDFASLYPMIQLTYDVFPIFDITNIIKRLLKYLTTTRNVYKNMASGNVLSESEITILRLSGFDNIIKAYETNQLTDTQRVMFDILQLPIKILNNSLFGALGSGFSFNWSDNVCASRITTTGRLELRKLINWFVDYGCTPLLCVTDGVNFSYPINTNIIFDENGESAIEREIPIEEGWKFNGKVGIDALIDKYNYFLKSDNPKTLIEIDNDGEFVSCLNLKRNNYALYYFNKRKNKMDIKYIGGMIKSKVLSTYIEEFIDKGLHILLDGRSEEFVKYYHEYCEDIFYNRIPLRKIVSKRRVKESIEEYINRGFNKNGRPKAKKAHMELLMIERLEMSKKIFREKYDEIVKEYGEKVTKLTKGNINEYLENLEDFRDIIEYVHNWIPNEPELDATLYLVNTGEKISDGDSAIIIDSKTGEKRIASMLIDKKEMEDNPDLIVPYNNVKYLDAFNKKVKPLLTAFDKDVAKEILTKIKTKRYKDEFGNRKVRRELVYNLINDDKLVIGATDLDSLEESYYMEKSEIYVWNRFGYNPYLIWNELKADETLRYDIYDSTLNYLNKKMDESGKDKIIRVDDIRKKNDLILLKRNNNFSVGHYNGEYVNIIRKNIVIPDLEILDYDNIVYEFEKEFREKYKIGENINLFELFNLQPKSKDAYNDMVKEFMMEDESMLYIDY